MAVDEKRRRAQMHFQLTEHPIQTKVCPSDGKKMYVYAYPYIVYVITVMRLYIHIDINIKIT